MDTAPIYCVNILCSLFQIGKGDINGVIKIALNTNNVVQIPFKIHLPPLVKPY